MKRQLLFFLIAFSYLRVHAQNVNLENRVKKFYQVQEDMSLTKEEKIKQLKKFIVPGPSNDSMAYFFYNSWNNNKNNSKLLESKIVKIEYSEDGSKGFVSTEDVLEYRNGEVATFLSRAMWVRLKDNWYRSDRKSELYKNGKRIR